MDLFTILIVVMVSTYQMVQFKYIYLIKAVAKNPL